MSDKIKKQFGVWMDSHHATVAGRNTDGDGEFVILGHVKNSGAGSNSNENTQHNHEQSLTHSFFKDIAALMQNVDEIHVTGTGDAQEQFIKFLSETPQYKNASATESTSTKMGDEHFIDFISAHYN